MRARWEVELFVAFLVLGCNAAPAPQPVADGGSGLPPPQPAADGGGVPQGPQAPANPRVPPRAEVPGPPTRQHGVVERTCPRAPYGSDWLLVPTSTDCGGACYKGTECASNADCKAEPFGRCIGLADGVCKYSTAREPPEQCDVDSDCEAEPGASCVKEIAFTFCLYDACERDADCESGAVCQCPDASHADPWCVPLGCDSAADCEPGQTCRTDGSITGIQLQRHCTTSHDRCQTDADCQHITAGRCGFDAAESGWSCRSEIIVD